MGESGASGVALVLRRARQGTSAYFFVMGMTAGVWMARIPAVKAQAGLSDAALGAALFAVPVGLVLGAALAERLVDRVGSALVARVAGVGNCLLAVPAGLARNLAELMAALLLFGLAGGTLDVAQNAQGVRVEADYRRPVMTSMHSFYSLGAMAGALAGGGFAWAGLSPALSLAAAGAVGALTDGFAGRWLLPGAPSRASAAGATAAGAAGKSALPARPPRRSAEARRVRRLIIALGVLAICGMVGEGAAGDWSAVYLKDSLGTSAGFAALAFAAFSVTMTAGRAVGDGLIHRFGTVPVIRCCGLLAAAGLTGALVSRNPGAAIGGFAVFGAGLSVVVPQVFAAGGRADPARPGSGLAKVVGLGYAGLAAGPAVIGAAASQLGLHRALGIPVLLTLWIAAGAAVLAPRRGERDGGGGGTGPFRTKGRGASVNRHRRAYGMDMDDKEILARINGLIATERELRTELADGRLSSEQERERLRSAEEALDQCWDLLRQRRARREFGENPDAAEARPAAEVEGYQQ